MGGELRFDRARTISFDFDGVLSTLVMGRRWIKTKARKREIPILSPLGDGFKALVGSLTQALRGPFPHADEVLCRLKSSERTLYVLTSRTGAGVGLARRWLERRGWLALFEQEFYNVKSDDADAFKAGVLRSMPIDVHIDDDPETLGFLAGEFPERLFVHMNCYDRKGLTAPNVVAVRSWRELPALFFPEREGAACAQKE